MKEVIDFIDSNYERYLDELKEFLRIPSISTLPEHSRDMQTAAEFVAAKLKDAGMNKVEIFQTEGHPLVYAEWLGAPGKPTVLIYGHYDVQPVDPIELWESPPFEPTIKGDNIYARGATDDKGQMFVHIKSVEAYFKTYGSLPLNVKFIIEGEEEIGSSNLTSFLKNNVELLKADAVLISDTSLYDVGVPTITYGLRGLAYMEVEVVGPNRDLHSGTYGGAVPNPINILAEMIAKLKDKDAKITITGFYKDVLKLTKEERQNFKALKFSEKEFARSIGIKKSVGEKGYSVLERIWARPTLDCNGIVGGFTGQGAKTVIPSKASAKISMRLVPNQDPKKIEKLFTKYIKQIAPDYVNVKVTSIHGGYPVLAPLDHKATKAAARAMSKAFGKKTIFMREGGSIPIVVDFANRLKACPVLMGLGLDSENLHSPNEHFNLNHFKLGIKSSAYFLDEFSRV
ncbi:Acetylornithine deacetylase-like protein [Ignavibacterium album JCM 16511]|uniref:Acetylornithine deacetylase-like protein n=1 Tax=Ignavibacterium album (strain DSM 19864 / JCM 16511 / NBRC 101810 / Mat9-16) TaxID=945713 RepID=I0AHP5_IGNAJ|nr:dipeptidase [Ignavibacterium album]AFH48502.1 Acetylornithine deacetylase-like protein [Ignavibacterium album JCM 16511]